jgi:tetratricopeptide (TPR) repeat protein
MTRYLRNLTLAAVASAAAGGLLFGKSDEPAKPDRRASAYYHATLGHMYSELAAAYGGRGEYLSKAIENYKLAMREDPATAYLPQELADLYLQSGQARIAIAEFEDALKKNPDDLNARRILARFYTARISQGQQQRMNEDMLRAAIEQYQKISEQAPKDLENWLMLGRLQKLATNSAAAEKAYKKALELDPDGEEALTGLAMVYGDLGDNTNATLLLKRVAEKSPSLRTLTALAIAYDQMKDYKGSAEAYRRALELNRENTDLKTAYAEELLKTGDDNEALKVFQEIAAEEPSHLGAALKISEIYRQKRDFAKAHQYADKASELDPTNLEAQFNQVSLLEAEGKPAEAIRTLKEVLDGMPKKLTSPGDRTNRAFLLERLGILYRLNDQTEQAVAAFREIIDLDPDSGARAAAQILETYTNGKDYAAAEREAAVFTRQYPQDRIIKTVNADLQADLGQFKEAESTLKSLLDGKSDREVWIALSQVYEKAKNWTAMGQAIDQVEKLGASSEEKEDAMFLRGAMFERMKKFEQSEAEFRKVLQTDPASARTLNYLGYMLADRNARLNEALEMIQKAVDQEPTNSAYLDSLGWVYYRLNKLEEAEDNLRRSLQYGSRDAAVYDHLGDVYLSRNKLKDAIKQWERSLKEWQTASPSEADPAEIVKVQKKLEKAKVRLAQEHGGAKREE